MIQDAGNLWLLVGEMMWRQVKSDEVIVHVVLDLTVVKTGKN